MEVYSSQVNSTGAESRPLITDESSHDDEVQIQVYRRRWYILLLFSLFCFTQGATWNTFGPISTSCEEAFGWNDATIAWLSNWGGVSFVLTSFLFYWLMQVKGLRWAVLSSTFFLLVGTALRVITSEPRPATVFIHIAQFVSGLAGPIAMGANPTVSAVWFPPRERVTATAISSSLGYFGVAISYLLGPLIVERGLPAEHNVTQEARNIDFVFAALSENTTNLTDVRVNEEREHIMLYMYISCAWCAALFLAMLCYFPNTPPLPPSISANTERQHYWTGLRSLFGNKYYLIIAIAYGISVGAYGAWSSVLNVNLRPAGVSQKEAGWIGFYSTVSSCTAAILVGRFADHFARYMKTFIFVLYVLCTGCFLVFSLDLLDGVLPYSDGVLYGTVIVGSSLLLAATPMIFELACEMAYPASEGAANGMLAFLNNFVGVLFFIPFAVPNVGTMWMNWVLTAACGVCMPLIAVMQGSFNRLALDECAVPHMLIVNQDDDEDNDDNSVIRQMYDNASNNNDEEDGWDPAFLPWEISYGGNDRHSHHRQTGGGGRGLNPSLLQPEGEVGSSTSITTPVEVYAESGIGSDASRYSASLS